MALPVAQIMSQLQTGDCEDIEEDDIAEGPELEDEGGNEELFKDTKLEISEGTHWYPLVPVGTRWYLLVPVGTSWYSLVGTSTYWWLMRLMFLMTLMLLMTLK